MTATYEKIQSNTLGSAQATVTFSTISGSYTDLVVICNFGASSSAEDFIIRFNSDTGSNYSFTNMRGNGTTTASDRGTSSIRIAADLAGVSTTLQAIDIIQVMNYSNTTTYKTALIRANDAGKSAEATVGLWRNTAAITSITLAMTSGNLLSGSSFTVYGIKAE